MLGEPAAREGQAHLAAGDFECERRQRFLGARAVQHRGQAEQREGAFEAFELARGDLGEGLLGNAAAMPPEFDT